jgi:hypothetical protein
MWRCNPEDDIHPIDSIDISKRAGRTNKVQIPKLMGRENWNSPCPLVGMSFTRMFFN